MKWEELLDSDFILTEPVPTKEQAVEALVDLLDRRHKLRNAAHFREALRQHEAEFAAELAPDIAVPHLRSEEVKESSLAAARTADGQTVFLLASRNEKEHLQRLSQLAEALLEEPSQKIFEKK